MRSLACLPVVLLASAVAPGTLLAASAAGEEPPVPVLQMAPSGANAIAFSPDGKWMASASGGICLWEPKSRALVREFTGDVHGTTALAFSPDSKTIACGGGADSTAGVSLWEVRTGKLLHSWGAPGQAIYSISFTQQGTLYAVGLAADGKTVRAWRADGELPKWTGQQPQREEQQPGDQAAAMPPQGAPSRRRRPPVAADIRTAVLSPAADAVAVISSAGPMARTPFSTVTLRNPRSGAVARTLKQKDVIFSAVFSPDGKFLATGGFTLNKEVVSVWDARTGKLLRSMTPAGQMITALAFSPDGKSLAGGDFVIKVWDARTGAIKRKLASQGDQVSRLAFSPDGGLLATAANALVLWDAKTGMRKGAFGLVRFENAVVDALAISPDGSTLATNNGDNTLRLWNLRTGTLQRTIIADTDAQSLTFSPDGRLLAAGVSLWDVATGELVHSLKVDTSSSVFSPDGALLATSGEGLDKTQLWEVGTGKLKRDLGIGFGVAFSPDGRLLAVGGYDKTEQELAESDPAANPAKGVVRLWDEAGRLVRTWTGEPMVWPMSLGFSRDGRLLACGMHPPLVDYECVETRVWDVQSGELVRTLHGELLERVLPNGMMVTLGFGASGQRQEWARLRDMGSGALLRAIPGVGFPWALSPAGDRFATSDGREVEVREATTGRTLLTLLAMPPEGGKISTEWLAFTPDGDYASSPGAGRFVRWRVGEELLSAEQCEQRFHRKRPDLTGHID